MPRLVPFSRTDRTDVLGRMVGLRDDQPGWLVMLAEPDTGEPDADQTQPRLSAGIFSGRGPDVPELSWVPPTPARRHRDPLAVGIRHGSGPKAARRLAAAGHPVPEGWRVTDDSPRRGLVLDVPADAADDVVLDWLLDAAEHLSNIELSGRWVAQVHHRV